MIFYFKVQSNVCLVEEATAGIVIIVTTFQHATRLFYPYALIINPRYYGTWILNETQQPPIAVTRDVTSRPIDRFEIISNPFSSSSVFKRHEAILIKRYNVEPDELASNPGIQRKLHPRRPSDIH